MVTKIKRKLRKDGQPRQKPGPKPKPIVQRLGPAPLATRGRRRLSTLSYQASEDPAERMNDMAVQEALDACKHAYQEMATKLLGFETSAEKVAEAFKDIDGTISSDLKDRYNLAERMACTAYRCALPTLRPGPARQAFVACVAQGVALDVFTGKVGSQLLYAAQVCSSSRG